MEYLVLYPSLSLVPLSLSPASFSFFVSREHLLHLHPLLIFAGDVYVAKTATVYQTVLLLSFPSSVNAAVHTFEKDPVKTIVKISFERVRKRMRTKWRREREGGEYPWENESRRGGN